MILSILYQLSVFLHGQPTLVLYMTSWCHLYSVRILITPFPCKHYIYMHEKLLIYLVRDSECMTWKWSDQLADCCKTIKLIQFGRVCIHD